MPATHDPSLEAPTLRDIDYLERRIQALEERLDQMDRRGDAHV